MNKFKENKKLLITTSLVVSILLFFLVGVGYYFLVYLRNPEVVFSQSTNKFFGSKDTISFDYNSNSSLDGQKYTEYTTRVIIDRETSDADLLGLSAYIGEDNNFDSEDVAVRNSEMYIPLSSLNENLLIEPITDPELTSLKVSLDEEINLMTPDLTIVDGFISEFENYKELTVGGLLEDYIEKFEYDENGSTDSSYIYRWILTEDDFVEFYSVLFDAETLSTFIDSKIEIYVSVPSRNIDKIQWKISADVGVSLNVESTITEVGYGDNLTLDPASRFSIIDINQYISYANLLLGDPRATVIMDSYIAVDEPFTGQFLQNAFPEIYANYIESGEVLFNIVPANLEFAGATSESFSRLACGIEQGQMKYTLMTLGEGLTDQAFVERASEDLETFDTGIYQDCVKDNKYKDLFEKLDSQRNKQIFTGVPSFLVYDSSNTEEEPQLISGAQQYDNYKEVLDGFLTK